jgi:hypothetical protein
MIDAGFTAGAGFAIDAGAIDGRSIRHTEAHGPGLRFRPGFDTLLVRLGFRRTADWVVARPAARWLWWLHPLRHRPCRLPIGFGDSAFRADDGFGFGDSARLGSDSMFGFGGSAGCGAGCAIGFGTCGAVCVAGCAIGFGAGGAVGVAGCGLAGSAGFTMGGSRSHSSSTREASIASTYASSRSTSMSNGSSPSPR